MSPATNSKAAETPQISNNCSDMCVILLSRSIPYVPVVLSRATVDHQYFLGNTRQRFLHLFVNDNCCNHQLSAHSLLSRACMVVRHPVNHRERAHGHLSLTLHKT